jgi:ribosomal protein S6--L-glutamate ligase
MNLVSFDPMRSLGIPCTGIFRPEDMLRYRDQVMVAECVLFPQSWQLNVLGYAWKLRTFPSYSTYDVGYDKVEMTRAFTAVAPEHCPRTLILPPSPSGAEEAVEELGFPFVVKHPRSSMGLGVELVESRADLQRWLATAPVLYAQEYLSATQDLRVVWVGDRVVTAYWRRGGDGFRHNVARGGELSFEGIPDSALELVARVATTLGIDHAGFDLAVIDGWPYLIELNCLFGHAGVNARGIRLGPMILDYLERILRPGDEPAPPVNRAA